MQVKPCTKCGVQKPLDAFNRRSSLTGELRNACRACESNYNAARRAVDPAAHKAKVRAYEVANRDAIRAHKQHYYLERREAILQKQRDHRTDPAVRERKSAYDIELTRRKQKESPEHYAARTAARKAARLRATPPWADFEKIASIYAEAKKRAAETGVPHHVDHIVPLRSPIVCGLHCQDNLWILPARINLQKSNRYWPGGPL